MKWGILGAGRIAAEFANDLSLVPGAMLAGVHSRRPEGATRLALAHHAVPFAHADDLLGDARVNAIYIATPTHTHFLLAQAALQAGKSVLVEKPLAVTAEQGRQLQQLAKRKGLFLMEGMWIRFLPSIRFMHHLVRSQKLGEIQRITGELAFLRQGEAYSQPGSGVLHDLGVYLISLSLMLLGRPKEMSAKLRCAANGVEMSARMELAWKNVHASLSCGHDRNGANLFVIEGSKASLILQPPFISAKIVLTTPNPAARMLERLAGSMQSARTMIRILGVSPGVRKHAFPFPGYGLQFETAAASTAIARGEMIAPVSPLEDSIETLRIIDQLRQS